MWESGTFSDHISVQFCLVLRKSAGFVPFAATLTNFGPNLPSMERGSLLLMMSRLRQSGIHAISSIWVVDKDGRFGSKVGQIGLRIGQIWDFFRYDFSTSSQMYWNLILKVPDLSNLGSIWPTLEPNLPSLHCGTKPYIQVTPVWWKTYYFCENSGSYCPFYVFNGSYVRILFEEKLGKILKTEMTFMFTFKYQNSWFEKVADF